MQHRFRSRLRAQAQALAILGTTLSLPGASALARIGKQPAPSETTVAGIATTVVRPAGRPPWPALVFMNGATPDGRSHPTVHRLSLALARAGVRVFIPDLAGVAGGELSPGTLAQSVAVSEAASGSPETADGRVALVGVSVGGTLALLAAADARLRQRISVVACVAPFGDLAAVMRLATTGSYQDGQRVAAPAYLLVGLARSLGAMLAVTPATASLCKELRALDHESSSPVELPERAFREAGAEAERLYDLLANTDPARFDSLYAALPVLDPHGRARGHAHREAALHADRWRDVLRQRHDRDAPAARHDRQDLRHRAAASSASSTTTARRRRAASSTSTARTSSRSAAARRTPARPT